MDFFLFKTFNEYRKILYWFGEHIATKPKTSLQGFMCSPSDYLMNIAAFYGPGFTATNKTDQTPPLTEFKYRWSKISWVQLRDILKQEEHWSQVPYLGQKCSERELGNNLSNPSAHCCAYTQDTDSHLYSWVELAVQLPQTKRRARILPLEAPVTRMALMHVGKSMFEDARSTSRPSSFTLCGPKYVTDFPGPHFRHLSKNEGSIVIFWSCGEDSIYSPNQRKAWHAGFNKCCFPGLQVPVQLPTPVGKCP